MPSSKTLSIIILCGAMVLSIWLINKNNLAKESLNPIAGVESTASFVPENFKSNEDWKKMISTVNATTEVASALKDVSVPEDATLTNQFSIDFMSQYIRVKGSGIPLDNNSINGIANSILSNPQYLKSEGAIYIKENLNIDSSFSQSSKASYKQIVFASIKDGFAKVKVEPILILKESVDQDDERILTALDPIIAANKKVISDMLNVTVPKAAVTLHLNLMNALSDMLSDTESMRVFFADPTRSLGAIRNYQEHMATFIDALSAMNKYLASI